MAWSREKVLDDKASSQKKDTTPFWFISKNLAESHRLSKTSAKNLPKKNLSIYDCGLDKRPVQRVKYTHVLFLVLKIDAAVSAVPAKPSLASKIEMESR